MVVLCHCGSWIGRFYRHCHEEEKEECHGSWHELFCDATDWLIVWLIDWIFDSSDTCERKQCSFYSRSNHHNQQRPKKQQSVSDETNKTSVCTIIIMINIFLKVYYNTHIIIIYKTLGRRVWQNKHSTGIGSTSHISSCSIFWFLLLLVVNTLCSTHWNLQLLFMFLYIPTSIVFLALWSPSLWWWCPTSLSFPLFFPPTNPDRNLMRATVLEQQRPTPSFGTITTAVVV